MARFPNSNMRGGGLLPPFFKNNWLIIVVGAAAVYLLISGGLSKFVSKISETLSNVASAAGEAISGGVKSVSNAVGVTDSQSVKASAAQASIQSPFSPRYYTQFSGAKIIKAADVARQCKMIYDNIGWFSTKPDVVLGVFKELGYKTQVSYLAEKFQSTYRRDLNGFLYSHSILVRSLEEADYLKIVNYVNSLK